MSDLPPYSLSVRRLSLYSVVVLALQTRLALAGHIALGSKGQVLHRVASVAPAADSTSWAKYASDDEGGSSSSPSSSSSSEGGSVSDELLKQDSDWTAAYYDSQSLSKDAHTRSDSSSHSDHDLRQRSSIVISEGYTVGRSVALDKQSITASRQHSSSSSSDTSRRHGPSNSKSSSSSSKKRRRLGEAEASADQILPGFKGPSKCASPCINGTCHEEVGRCDCPRNRAGADCSTVITDQQEMCTRFGFKDLAHCFIDAQQMCLNSCNLRGTCIASGFCRCNPGFYGTDCSLSLDANGKPELLLGQHYKVRSSGPRIYVYELPPMFSAHHNLAHLDRPLHALLWQRLLSAGVRVANGEEADYYFMPLNLRTDTSRHIGPALSYIQAHWPWWDRYKGGRHLFVSANDMGRDELRPPDKAATASSIWLSHWGLTQTHPIAGWREVHRPGQDIIIPVMLPPMSIWTGSLQNTPLHPASPHYFPPRNLSSSSNGGNGLGSSGGGGLPAVDPHRKGTLYMAGRVCGDRQPPLADVPAGTHVCSAARNDYSATTRAQVYSWHHHRPGYKIVTGSPTFGRDMTEYKFCLAPTGGGHGKRNVMVAVMGCIPVTVTDYVLQPYEPELDWSTFSIPLSEKDIPVLHEILANVTDEKLLAYQARLTCAIQHLYYTSFFGAIFEEDGRFDAFETLMAILAVRLRHPGVPPQHLQKVDAEFKAFMACEPAPTPASPRHMCSNSAFESPHKLPTCASCRSPTTERLGMSGQFIGWPGGPVCCAEPRVGRCPRLWP